MGVVAEVRQDVLQAEEEHAKDLESRFLASITAFGVILDSTPRVTDLGWLPGDDDIIPKRKCLKRLRLQKRKKAKKATADAPSEEEEPAKGKGKGKGKEPAGDADDAEEGVSVPRFEVRTWKPIPEFGKLSIKAVERESARLESERRSARGEEVEEPEDGDEPVPANDGSLTTLVTTAHRQFIKARDAKYDEYRKYFFERMMQTEEEYDKLLAEELAWAGNWSTMVEFLKKNEDDSDDEQ